MSDEEKAKIIRAQVDMLIETLGEMQPDQADAVVRDVATTLMTDVLGLKGYIKIAESGMFCGTKGCTKVCNYKWEEV